MRPKSLILLGLALGCGLVASIGISQVMDNGRDAISGYETTSIYVAMHNINLNDPIDPTMVQLQDWPTDKVPQGAITKLEDLEDRRPRALIIQGEPILEGKLLKQGEVHDPIGQIPPGMRLKTISVDAEKSAAGLLSPGDRVDVQLYVKRNPKDGIDVPRLHVILQNIRVYAVDQQVQRASDGGESRSIGKTVSLLLTPEQANKLSLSEQIGEVNLIPRSPSDDDTVNSTAIQIDDLWNDHKSKNSVAQEQSRDQEQQPNSGLLSELVAKASGALETEPPFVMQVIEAAEIREVTFDPKTGRPLHSSSGSSATGYTSPAAGGGSNGNSGPSATDFPIDF